MGGDDIASIGKTRGHTDRNGITRPVDQRSRRAKKSHKISGDTLLQIARKRKFVENIEVDRKRGTFFKNEI